MVVPSGVVAQGLPDVVTDLVGIAGTLVLLLMLVALVAFAYKSLTGGVDWPDDEEPAVDDDEVTEGGQDDEWKYY